jgi:hypothetical protein
LAKEMSEQQKQKQRRKIQNLKQEQHEAPASSDQVIPYVESSFSKFI